MVLGRVEGLEQRAAHQEPLVVQLALQGLGAGGGGPAAASAARRWRSWRAWSHWNRAWAASMPS